jgi:transcriptional regulator with XRE-family HTH domain
MPINQLEIDRHHELAAFLRNRRARIVPEQVGLPTGTRRRTPGLRRGEVALLAGVTPEWYSKLEQGQDIHVSVQLLERLASVLQLNADERAHLFLLALRQPPPVEMFVPVTISSTFHQFLQQLGTTPVCVIDARLNVVGWNRAFHVTLGGYTVTTPERERNIIWRLFTPPVVRWQGSEEWEKLASVFLAQFRAGYGRFIDDPWWSEQITELSRISPAFRELWGRHDVLNGPQGWKSIPHPRVGELLFDFFLLQAADSCDAQLLIYSPRKDSGTIEKIERLLASDQ